MLSPEIERATHDFIQGYCQRLKGVHFEAVGGTETHVHLAVQLEPFVAPSEFIGKLKGASSHEIDRRFSKGTLAWQRGYGVVSFAARDLPAVRKYIAEQKEHHRQGTVRDALESHGAHPDEARREDD